MRARRRQDISLYVFNRHSYVNIIRHIYTHIHTYKFNRMTSEPQSPAGQGRGEDRVNHKYAQCSPAGQGTVEAYIRILGGLACRSGSP